MNETWLLNLLAERRTRRPADTELAGMNSTVHACRVRLLTVTTVGEGKRKKRPAAADQRAR